MKIKLQIFLTLLLGVTGAMKSHTIPVMEEEILKNEISFTTDEHSSLELTKSMQKVLQILHKIQEEKDIVNEEKMYDRTIYKSLIKSINFGKKSAVQSLIQALFGTATIVPSIVAIILMGVFAEDKSCATIFIESILELVVIAVCFRFSFYITKMRFIAFIITFTVMKTVMIIIAIKSAAANKGPHALGCGLLTLVSSTAYMLVWYFYYFKKNKVYYLKNLKWLMSHTTIKHENNEYHLLSKKQVNKAEISRLASYSTHYLCA